MTPNRMLSLDRFLLNNPDRLVPMRDLHEIRDRSRIGTKRSGLFKRKRSKLNILFGVTAIFLLIFALVGVPVFEIGIDDGSDPSPAFQKVEEVEQS